MNYLISGGADAIVTIAIILASRKIRNILTAGVEIECLRQEIKLVQLQLDNILEQVNGQIFRGNAQASNQ